ncbi:MAG: hypothetical protein ACOX3K_00405 [Bacilli bacterium]
MRFPKKISFVLPLFLLLTACEGILKKATVTDPLAPPEPVTIERALNAKEKVEFLANVQDTLKTLKKLTIFGQQSVYEDEMSMTIEISGSIKLFQDNAQSTEVTMTQIMRAPAGEMRQEVLMAQEVFSDDDTTYSIEVQDGWHQFYAQPKAEEEFPAYLTAWPDILGSDQPIFLGADGCYYMVILDMTHNYYANSPTTYRHTVREMMTYLKIRANYEMERFFDQNTIVQLTTDSEAMPPRSEMKLSQEVNMNYEFVYGKLDVLPGKAEKIANFPKIYVSNAEVRAQFWHVNFDDVTGAPTISNEGLISDTRLSGYGEDTDITFKTTANGDFALHIYCYSVAIELNEAISLSAGALITDSFEEVDVEVTENLDFVAANAVAGLTFHTENERTYLMYVSEDEDASPIISIDIEVEMNISCRLQGGAPKAIWNIVGIKIKETKHYGIPL